MRKQLVLVFCMLLPFFLFAQKKKSEQYVIQYVGNDFLANSPVSWHSYMYSNESKLWSFAVVIQGDSLMASVLVKDPVLISEAIRNGILLNMSYSDKKKDGAQLLFPRLNLEELEKMIPLDSEEKVFTNSELIQSTKGYYVKGFNRIRDGLLSFDNMYGIHAKAEIDSANYLRYSASIPLSLVAFKTKAIAVQLAINTEYAQMKKALSNRNTASYRGVYGRPVNQPSLKNPYQEETAVWFDGNLK